MRSAAAVLSGGQASQRYSRARTSLDEVSWPLPPGSKPVVGQSEMCSDRAKAVEAVVSLRGVLRRKCLHLERCWRSDAAGDAENCRARAERQGCLSAEKLYANGCMRDVGNDYCVMFLCNIRGTEELDRLNALGFRFCSDVTVVPVARHLINVQHKRASKELRSTLEHALGPLAQGLLPTCARVTASHPSKARRNALTLLIKKHDRRQSSLSRTICLQFIRTQKPH